MWITVRKWLIRNPVDLITEREWEIIIAACVHEMNIRDIAERLTLEYDSTRKALSRIYIKLGVHSMSELRDWFDETYPPTGMNYRDYDDGD